LLFQNEAEQRLPISISNDLSRTEQKAKCGDSFSPLPEQTSSPQNRIRQCFHASVSYACPIHT
ncbi:MAG: hypothetical protein ACPG5T_07870, partial [Endozoicomonas sp.]